MSIPYVIILSDSEDEDEPMMDANIPPNSDDESHDSNPMEEDLSDEEEPSEDEAVPETPPQSPITPPQPSETSLLSPVHSTYDLSGPHTIRTRGKSVAGSHRSMAPPSESTSPTDPYVADRVWNYLPTTLHEWRKEEKIPSITEVGESSTAPRDYPFTHEPPHHTIPLLVTRAIRHEDRLNHIEDALIEMQFEEDVVENMQYQIGSLDTNLESVRGAAEELKQRGIHRDIRSAALESRMLQRMDQIDTRLAQMDAMVSTLRDFITFLMKGDHFPKK